MQRIDSRESGILVEVSTNVTSSVTNFTEKATEQNCKMCRLC